MKIDQLPVAQIVAGGHLDGDNCVLPYTLTIQFAGLKDFRPAQAAGMVRFGWNVRDIVTEPADDTEGEWVDGLGWREQER